MFYDRKKYILENSILGRYQLLTDPEGWDTQVRKNTRSAKNLSFTAKYTNNIVFVKDGADYILNVLRNQGVEAEIKYTEFDRNPITNEFIEGYTNNIDLYTLKEDDNKTSVDFIETGLKTKINDLRKEKFELDRITDINGNSIESLKYDTISLPGRKVFLQSKALIKSDLDFKTASRFSIPAPIAYSSDDRFRSVINTRDDGGFGNISNSGRRTWDLSQSFFSPGKQKNVEIIVSAKFEFGFRNIGYKYLRAYLIYGFDDGTEIVGDLNNQVLLYDYETSSNSVNKVQVDFSKKINNYNIPQNAYLSIYWEQSVSIQNQYKFPLKIDKGNYSIEVLEDSFFPETISECLTFENALNRWLYIATGNNNIFRSLLPVDSILKNFVISSGLQIRNFPRKVQTRVLNIDAFGQPDVVIESTIKASLDDLLTCDQFMPFGFDITNELFAINELDKFFVEKVGFSVDEHTRPTRQVATSFIFKNISIGNEKAGQYEEQVGLYEYNGNAKWSCFSSRSENEFKKESKLFTDPIGVEWARRSNIEVKPNSDTRYDDYIFGFHVKSNGVNSFTPRLWRDDLETAPQVYDPESAYNLMLSPANCLKRWGRFLNIGLDQYPSNEVVFTSSTGYDKLVTKIVGEDAIKESQNHPNSSLGIPYFKPEVFEFTTVFKGKDGFFQKQKTNDLDFMKNQIELLDTGEKGFILDSEIKGNEAKFTVLKAYRR